MHVEIKDRDALGAGRRGFEHGDGDVVQVAKAHRLVARGVMAGRTHEAENIFAGARGLQRIQRGGRRTRGQSRRCFRKTACRRQSPRGICRRASIPASGRGECCASFTPVRRRPGDRQFRLASQKFERGGDARGTFGMALARIAGAVFIGDDFHCDSTIVSKNSGRLNYEKKIFCHYGAAGAFIFNAGAWDYEGHHAINELALASLPRDFGGSS